MFPMRPGYALGCLIKEADLSLPYYSQQQQRLVEELKTVQQKKKSEMTLTESSQDTTMEKTKKLQVIVDNYNKLLIPLQIRLAQMDQKIKNLFDETANFEIEESLPLDARAKIHTQDRAFQSERFQEFCFENKNTFREDWGSFIGNLFLEDNPFSLLPVGALDQMALQVGHLLTSGNAKVTVIGSVVTLSRVKVIEPMVVRKTIAQHLKNDPSKYYVLYEAILGGVFLGISKDVSTTEKNPHLENARSSSLLSISYVSQEALAKPSGKLQEQVLKIIYESWKEALEKDTKNGFPIKFKVRSLKSVLQENGIIK